MRVEVRHMMLIHLKILALARIGKLNELIFLAERELSVATRGSALDAEDSSCYSLLVD